MLEGLLAGMIDKVGITTDTIQDSLENTAKELGCSSKDFFYIIAPINEDFEFKCHIYKKDGVGIPKMIREITVKQIIDAKQP